MALKDFHHPFEPYGIQQQFMEALYDCIEKKQVGIFESPTGTGKSLSLICGSLTWLREHKRRKLDEALANVVIDADEPEWMAEYAREVRSREIRHMRDEFEARLVSVREREKKVRERLASREPVLKRQRFAHEAAHEVNDEDQFVLDNYESDSESAPRTTSTYSAETTKIMEKLGVLSKSDKHSMEDDMEEMKIYFCSRTHSQLSQFVGELKRVSLPPSFPPDPAADVDTPEEIKHLTLGSRKNLCINPQVSKLSSQVAINERCMELQQKGTSANIKCSFLPNMETQDVVLDFRDHALATIRDIEDLAALGSKMQICPYYASRPGIGPAEIVTLPYPLLLQKSAREALGISVKGHIIVIDEAHNLMNAVEGTYGAQISDAQLRRAKNGLIVYLQKFRNRLKGSNRSYVTQVVRVIDSLLQFTSSVANERGTGSMTSSSALLSGKAVDQIDLTKLVRYITDSKLARKVEGYTTYISQNNSTNDPKAAHEATTTPDIPTLNHVQSFLLTLMNPSREGRFMWSRLDGAVIIRYILLDPSEHFRDLVEDARAVILAGGTMSPMDDYKQQLFPYLPSVTTFSCGHLIPPSSLLVRAVTSDNHGTLTFSYKNRNDVTATRLGSALKSIADKVRGGMVVFFPSYGYLESVLSIWRSGAIMKEFESTKAVFFDSRTASADDVFRSYSEAVQTDARGALLFSVIGGKLSEGINFSDDLGRCVVVVGLPYPNLETPEWKAKMQYLEERALARSEPKGRAGREHAENVCMRSVNQAIGRAIRHKNDWAGIVLLDSRYADARIWGKLPGWMKTGEGGKTSGDVDDVVDDLGTFFKRRLA